MGVRAVRRSTSPSAFCTPIRGSDCVVFTGAAQRLSADAAPRVERGRIPLVPDNVVVEFVRLRRRTASTSLYLRLLNSVDQMRVAIDAVRKEGKVAEVCVCFSVTFSTRRGRRCTPWTATKSARACVQAGAHMLAIKDMAGLLKPRSREPRCAPFAHGSPVPFTRTARAAQSGVRPRNGAGRLRDRRYGDLEHVRCTSQPSMNAFLATMEKQPRDPKIDHLGLTPIVKKYTGRGHRPTSRSRTA